MFPVLWHAQNGEQDSLPPEFGLFTKMGTRESYRDPFMRGFNPCKNKLINVNHKISLGICK